MLHCHPAGLGLRARQRGSVFLLCLLLVSLLSLTASSFSSASSETLDIARDERGSLQAELMAESAMSFAQRQLNLDPTWNGTGDQNVQFADGASFGVEVLGAGAAGGIVVRVSGVDGESRSMLQAEIEPGGGGPSDLIKSCGFITYGGAIDMNNLTVSKGNALIVDDAEGVRDWNPTLEDWVQPAIVDGEILANNVQIPGVLYTYKSPLDGIDAGSRVTVTAPVRTPRLNMDAFLVPNTDTLIVTSPILKNLTTDKTVVVVVPPGTHIKLTKCNLKGGLVVYSENSYTPRDEPRNTIEWSSSKFGSSTPTGVIAGIGIIAPAAAVTHSYQQTQGYGLFYLKSAEHMNAINIQKGSLMVLETFEQTNTVDITYDASMWNDELSAFFDAGSSSSRVLSLQEYFPQN